MARRGTYQDKNNNVFVVRKVTNDHFQIIFDDYEQELTLNFDKHDLEYIQKLIQEIKEVEV